MTLAGFSRKALVQMANEATLCTSVVVIGAEAGPPTWVQCSVAGSAKIAAQQISVIRAEGEGCTSLWARVLSAIRELKIRRGLYASVMVHCLHDTPPANADRLDRRFNKERTWWHRADHHPCSVKRVLALGALASLYGMKKPRCAPPGLH